MKKPSRVQHDIGAVHCELARRRMRHFIGTMKPNYIFRPFNEYIMGRLDAFWRGEIKKLMVLMPPQHGKTDLNRYGTAFGLGKCPEKKIAVAAYAATVAHDIARDIKNIIVDPQYRQIFPGTVLGKKRVLGNKGQERDGSSYINTSHYYQTVPYGGGVYSTGRGGPLTSKTVDVMIIDDLLKDRAEATSPTIRNKIRSWHNDVVRARLHNGSQELYFTTRWSEDDQAGQLLKKEDDWEVIIFPAIKTDDYCKYDNRQPGEPLFPEKHSLEKLLRQKKSSEVSFNALYQQDPKPNMEMLVHPGFKKVDRFPDTINRWVIGIDFGWNDPTAVVLIGKDEDRRYWKTLLYMPGRDIVAQKREAGLDRGDERSQNIIVQAICDVIKAAGMWGRTIYAEHDKAMVYKLQVAGATAHLAVKEVAAGLMSVNGLVNHYLESDTALDDEVRAYCWETVGEIILERPLDGNDHIMNAGRYAIHTDLLMYPY